MASAIIRKEGCTWNSFFASDEDEDDDDDEDEDEYEDEDDDDDPVAAARSNNEDLAVTKRRPSPRSTSPSSNRAFSTHTTSVGALSNSSTTNA